MSQLYAKMVRDQLEEGEGESNETTPILHDAHAQDIGGAKNISFFGGLTLLVNSITGPGLVTIPILFQQAGWFTPMVTMIFISVVSSLSATMLTAAMEKVKGNERFNGRVEFSGVAREFFPRWAFVLTMFLLVVSLMALLVSSVIISAQTMDLTLLAIFKKSYALEFYPHPFHILETSSPGTGVSPFGDAYVLSLGYLIVLVLTIPMGLFNLTDNIIIQNGAFAALLLIFTEWFINMFIVGLKFERTPFFADNQSQVLGTIIFNYAFVTTVPSWINEKRPDVSINKSVWLSTAIATVFYSAVGMFGAWAFTYHQTQDLLDVIDEQSHGPLHVVSMVTVYIFPIVAFLSSIPVFSIIIKYNLVENKICNKVVANFWAVVFPWVISIVFYTGSGLVDIINWTSLGVNGFINFVIPMLLYIIARRRPVDNGNLQEVTDESEDPDSFHPLPKWKWLNADILAWALIIVTTILLVAIIVINIVTVS